MDTIFKNAVNCNSVSKEIRNSVKPVENIPGCMYGLWKVHNYQVDICHLFRPILPALQTHNLAKFLVLILNPLSKNEYTVRDLFHFAEEICEEYPTLSISSLDIDSLFTNILFDKTIDICDLRYLRYLTCFIFNGSLYKTN